MTLVYVPGAKYVQAGNGSLLLENIGSGTSTLGDADNLRNLFRAHPLRASFLGSPYFARVPLSTLSTFSLAMNKDRYIPALKRMHISQDY